MFDLSSTTYIKWYKNVTIIVFVICMILGVFGAISDARGHYGMLDIGLGGDDDGFLDFISWVIIFIGGGFMYLVTNMLIIQLLNNIQTIREKVERM